MGSWMSLERVSGKDGFPETWKDLGLLIHTCMHPYTLSCLWAIQLKLACWGSLAMNMACELQSRCFSSSSLPDIVWQLKCQEGSHLAHATAGSWIWRMLTICLGIRLVQSSGDMQIGKVFIFLIQNVWHATLTRTTLLDWWSGSLDEELRLQKACWECFLLLFPFEWSWLIFWENLMT